MPIRVEWSKVASGSKFQEFANAFLLHEVGRHVRPYGKEGKDFGIDADYSGSYEGDSGKWVFQHKHAAKFSTLLFMVKRDVDKINVLRTGMQGKGKKATDPAKRQRGLELWRGVTHYRVLTNLRLSPQEQSDVLQALAPLGLNSALWDGHRIEIAALRHQFLLRAYFDPDAPLFWPPDEFEKDLQATVRTISYSTPPFIDDGRLGRLTDAVRQEGIRAVLVVGSGGIGKTRLLLETSKQLRSLAGDVPTARFVRSGLASVGDHLNELDPDESYALIVDEVADEDRFDQLLQLLHHPQFQDRVRLVVACRPTTQAETRRRIVTHVGSDDIIQIDLQPLGDKAKGLADTLGVPALAVDPLIEFAEGNPLWMILGAEQVKRGKSPHSLTQDEVVRAIIDKYLDEYADTAAESRRALLVLIAATQPVRLDKDRVIEAIAERLGLPASRVRRLCTELVSTGLARRRGRLIEIVPDFVADYVLRSELFLPDGASTGLHEELLKELPDELQGALINNVARGEYVARITGGQSILDQVVNAIRTELSESTNLSRLVKFERIGALALFRPSDYLDLVETVLDSPRDAGNGPGEEIYSVTDLEVLEATVAHLRAVRYEPDLVGRGLRLLARIMERGGYPTGRVLAAEECFDHIVSYHSPDFGGALSIQTEALAVLTEWVQRFKRDRSLASRLRGLTLANRGLRRILRVQFDDSRYRGGAVTIYSQRLRRSEAVGAIRDQALSLLLDLAADSEPEVRATAASSIGDVIHQLQEYGLKSFVYGRRTKSPEEAEETDEEWMARIGSESEEAVPPSEWRDELENVLDQIRRLVEAETNLYVLHSLRGALTRLRRDKAARVRATATQIIHEIDAKPGFGLYHELFSVDRDWNRDEELRTAQIDSILALGTAEDAAQELEAIFEAAPEQDRGQAQVFLERLGERSPAFTRQLVETALKDGLVSVERYSGFLLAGVRRVDIAEAQAFLRKLAMSTSGDWRALVVRTYWRLGFISRGFAPTREDREILERVLVDADQRTRADGVQAVIGLADSDRDWLIATLTAIAAPASTMVAAEMARALDHKFSTLFQDDLPGAKRLVETLLTVPGLTDLPRQGRYYLEQVFAKVAAEDIEWGLSIIERQIESGEGAFAVNTRWWRDEESFLSQATPSRDLTSAFERVLGWTKLGPELRDAAPHVLRALSGPEIGDDLHDALARLISPVMTIEDANSIIRVLDEFPGFIARSDEDEPTDVGERKLDLVRHLLVAAENFPLEERQSVRRRLTWSVKPHAWSRNVGQPSYLQTQTIVMLEQMQRDLDMPGCVRSWASETIATIKGDIEDQQNDDEEFRRFRVRVPGGSPA